MIRNVLLLSALISGCNLNDKPLSPVRYVIIAYKDIPAGLPIEEKDLFAVEIPVEYIPTGILYTPDHVVGRIPTQRILSNEFIRQENLLDAGSKGPQAVVGGPSQFTTQWAGSGKASITAFARGNEAFVGRWRCGS